MSLMSRKYIIKVDEFINTDSGIDIVSQQAISALFNDYDEALYECAVLEKDFPSRYKRYYVKEVYVYES